jgi:hypothetical protein
VTKLLDGAIYILSPCRVGGPSPWLASGAGRPECTPTVEPSLTHDIDSISQRVSDALNSIFYLARTALWPDKSLHLRWYDRILRAIGVLIILAVLVGLVYAALRGPEFL